MQRSDPDLAPRSADRANGRMSDAERPVKSSRNPNSAEGLLSRALRRNAKRGLIWNRAADNGGGWMDFFV